MKKILLPLILAFIVVATSVCVTATQTSADIIDDKVNYGTPTVDGILDDIYLNSLQVQINPPKYAGVDTAVSATVYALYDDNYVYVFYQVENDTTLLSADDDYIQDHPNPSHNDAVELRIGDDLEEHLPPYTGSNAAHHHFYMDAYGKRFSNYEDSIMDYIDLMKGASKITSDTSYNIEMAIPVANPFHEGDIIQFNFQVDDCQDAEAQKTGYIGLGDNYMQLTDFVIGEKNVTVEKTTCTVTFANKSQTEVNKGDTVSIPSITGSDSEYYFTGWMTEGDSTVYYPNDEYTVQSDITFYPVRSAALVVPYKTARTGENLLIPVTLLNNWYANSISFFLEYDKNALELTSVKNGNTFNSLESVDTSADTPKINLNSCKSEEGTAFTLNFKVKDSTLLTDKSVNIKLDTSDYPTTSEVYTLRNDITKFGKNIPTEEDVTEFIPGYVLIDEEIISVGQGTSVGFINVARAQRDTTPASHKAGTKIIPLQNIIPIKINISISTIIESGSCGDNVTYTLDRYGLLTISGNGEMDSYNLSSYTPWYSNRSSIKGVVIEEGVTSIGDYAFSECSNLKSVDIPDSVTNIGTGAFKKCIILANITIPNSVRTINSFAFYDCYGLTSITIPDSVTTIRSNTFAYCDSLTSVTIGNGVTTIDSNAFAYCKSLKSIVIPDSVTTIKDYAFYECYSLEKIVLGNNLTTIYPSVFEYCYRLVIHGYIGSYAEEYASRNSITFTSIDNDKTISSGSCGENVAYTLYADGFLIISGTGDMRNFNLASDVPWYSNQALIKYIIINDGVTSIGKSAFYGLSHLISIQIPESVTSIGESAFSDCSNITSITLGNSITDIGYGAFSRCKNLTRIVIPHSVSYLGNHAFNGCENLKNVTIGIGVTNIGSYLFNDCTSLESVNLSTSVTTIEEYAFYNCSNLTNVTMSNSITDIDKTAFENCTNLTVYSYIGSYAEVYANKNGISFAKKTSYDIILDASSTPWGIQIESIPCEDTYFFPTSSPSLSGCYFHGWKTEQSDDIHYPGDEYVLTGDTTFYAVWHTSLNVPAVEATIENSVSLPVTISMNRNLDSLKLLLQYDKTTFRLISVENGDTFNELKQVDLTADTPIIYLNGLKSEDGIAFTLNFEVLKDTLCGEYPIALMLDINDYIILDEEYTLKKNITKFATSIPTVEDVSNFIPANQAGSRYIIIDEEIFEVSSSIEAGFTNVSRGINGSTSMNHLAETKIKCLSKSFIFTKINNGKITVSDNNDTALLESITLTAPEKNNYTIGDTIDTTGMTVTANYSDGTSADVTADAKVDTTTLTTAGTVTVTVTYADKTATFNVTVAEKVAEPEDITQGTINETINWSIENDGTLRISGVGDIPSFSKTITPGWYAKRKLITSIVVEDGITGIGDYAFYNLENATTITIADSVYHLGQYFMRATGIEEITLNSAKEIVPYAFASTPNLKTIIFSENVKNFQGNILSNGEYSYTIKAPTDSYVDHYVRHYKEKYTSSLVTLTFESTGNAKYPVQHFSFAGDNVFFVIYQKAADNWAIEVTGSGVMKNFPYISKKYEGQLTPMYDIAEYTNNERIIKSIKVYDGVTTIGNYSFYKCNKATSLEFPNNITSIGAGAFWACAKLTEINIPETVTKIGKNAFNGCANLLSVTIPDSITEIGGNIFIKCNTNAMAVYTENPVVLDYLDEFYPEINAPANYEQLHVRVVGTKLYSLNGDEATYSNSCINVSPVNSDGTLGTTFELTLADCGLETYKSNNDALIGLDIELTYRNGKLISEATVLGTIKRVQVTASDDLSEALIDGVSYTSLNKLVYSNGNIPRAVTTTEAFTELSDLKHPHVALALDHEGDGIVDAIAVEYIKLAKVTEIENVKATSSEPAYIKYYITDDINSTTANNYITSKNIADGKTLAEGDVFVYATLNNKTYIEEIIKPVTAKVSKITSGIGATINFENGTKVSYVDGNNGETYLKDSGAAITFDANILLDKDTKAQDYYIYNNFVVATTTTVTASYNLAVLLYVKDATDPVFNPTTNKIEINYPAVLLINGEQVTVNLNATKAIDDKAATDASVLAHKIGYDANYFPVYSYTLVNYVVNENGTYSLYTTATDLGDTVVVADGKEIKLNTNTGLYTIDGKTFKLNDKSVIYYTYDNTATNVYDTFVLLGTYTSANILKKFEPATTAQETYLLKNADNTYTLLATVITGKLVAPAEATYDNDARLIKYCAETSAAEAVDGNAYYSHLFLDFNTMKNGTQIVDTDLTIQNGAVSTTAGYFYSKDETTKKYVKITVNNSDAVKIANVTNFDHETGTIYLDIAEFTSGITLNDSFKVWGTANNTAYTYKVFDAESFGELFDLAKANSITLEAAVGTYVENGTLCIAWILVDNYYYVTSGDTEVLKQTKDLINNLK